MIRTVSLNHGYHQAPSRIALAARYVVPVMAIDTRKAYNLETAEGKLQNFQGPHLASIHSFLR